MTCVIAMREPEKGIVHIAADKAISGGVAHNSGAQLARFPSGLVVGFAGSLATQNVMMTLQELAQANLGNDGSMGALYDKFQGIGAYNPPGALPKQFWAEMLLAMNGDLVYMGNASGWFRVKEPVKSIGDGERIALGSWFERGDLQPKERLERAIQVAAAFMPGGVSKESDYDHTGDDPLLPGIADDQRLDNASGSHKPR